jgi:hypothetical protein
MGCQVYMFPVTLVWISSMEEIHHLRLVRMLCPNHETNELLVSGLFLQNTTHIYIVD